MSRFLYKLVPVVVESLGGAFPELNTQAIRVAMVIREEEESFLRMLQRGFRRFENEAISAVASALAKKRGAQSHESLDRRRGTEGDQVALCRRQD